MKAVQVGEELELIVGHRQGDASQPLHHSHPIHERDGRRLLLVLDDNLVAGYPNDKSRPQPRSAFEEVEVPYVEEVPTAGGVDDDRWHEYTSILRACFAGITSTPRTVA